MFPCPSRALNECLPSPEEKVWGGLREVICWMGLAPKLSLKGHSSWRCWKGVVCGLRWSLNSEILVEMHLLTGDCFPLGKCC